MQQGRWNVLLDGFWGSSGKGKMSTYLADRFGITNVSSANFPNAGHTVRFQHAGEAWSFVAKAIPTAAALKREKGMSMKCFLSPGSGFSPAQLRREWEESGRPALFVHERASIVTSEHAQREREGADSTKHIASTMQGSGAAISDKVMRKADVMLAGTHLERVLRSQVKESLAGELMDNIRILDGQEFRSITRSIVENGHTWLHEGSQGYALSIDHGSHYPHCTSRNCTVQAAMDQMAVPPQLIGDVYLNLRTYPIRVGNVVEEGRREGFSGDFYPDCRELTWEEVAARAGMPYDEATKLAERERTTVTKRIRRVSTFSFDGLRDAVLTNGATKLCMNFIQYLNWQDAGIRGGKEALQKLSRESREFIDAVEERSGVPVVLIGTGADHEDIIDLL